jgi:hypothetical protein
MTEVWIKRGRKKRSLMAPILEQQPALVSEVVEVAKAVWSEARKSRHVMSADDDVY